MALIGFHISQENRADGVYIDWAIVAFYEMGTAQVYDERAKKNVTVETWDNLVDCKRTDIAALATWTRKVDQVGNKRVKFTYKDFGRIQTKAELEAFCIDELDKLKASHSIRESQRKAG